MPDDTTEVSEVYTGRFLILGSRGTGKSVFCLFLMILFIQAGNIPFLFNFRDVLGFFNGEVYFRVNVLFIDSVDAELYRMFYLYNSFVPVTLQFTNAINVVFSSPRIDCYREYRKGGTKKYYLPLWSEEEIAKLNAFIPGGCGKLSSTDLKYRFSWTGGVPRSIFIDWDKYINSVRESASGISLELLGHTRREMVLETGSHCIIGANVDVANEDESKRYKSFECCFLSNNVLKEVVDLFTPNPKSLAKFVLEIANRHCRSSLLHAAFQEAFGRFFDNAHKIKLIPLNDEARNKIQKRKKEWEIVLSVPEKILIAGEGEVKPSKEKAQLWIPHCEAFPVVDFIYTLPQSGAAPLIIGIKVTRDVYHGVSHKDLEKLVHPFEGRFILVWAIGTNIFKRFYAQSQKNSEGRNVSANDTIPLPQYKMDMCTGKGRTSLLSTSV